LIKKEKLIAFSQVHYPEYFMAHILTMVKNVPLCVIEIATYSMRMVSVSNVHRYIIPKDSLLRKELQ